MADAPKKEDEKKDEAAPTPLTDEPPVVTSHRIEVAGQTLSYTVTTGLMPIKDDKGEIEAQIFFMAYQRDDAGPARERPLMFSFNGGSTAGRVTLPPSQF